MDTIDDFTVEGTPEDIKTQLIAIETHMRRNTAAIAGSGRKDDMLVIAHNITDMAATQVGRVTDWLNQPYDLMAWASRNLFELHLLFRYGKASDENLKRLFTDYFLDAIEIDTRFMKLAEGNEAHRKAYEDRIALNQAELKKHNAQAESLISLNTIAQKFGLTNEYSALGKLTSKYVHPTSWRLIGLPSVTATVDIKNVLLTNVQLNALRILAEVCDVTKIPQIVPFRIVLLPNP